VPRLLAEKFGRIVGQVHEAAELRNDDARH
jgi:hypothetical protein